MNGVDLAKLHVVKGTRSIIDDIDDLRISFGFDSVEVTTPIVESRLRGGLHTNKPLSLNISFKNKNLIIAITFQSGYPKIPLELNVTDDNGIYTELQELANTVANTLSDDDTYPRAVFIVKEILNYYDSLCSVESNASNTDDSIEAAGNVDTLTEIANTIFDSDDAVLHQSVLEKCLEQSALQEAFLNTSFTCRICRKHLFAYTELHSHSTINYHSVKCTSYYLTEPPVHIPLASDKAGSQQQGVDVNSSEQSGHLICNCKAKVGNWSWTGNKCSCGEEWIAPMFQFVKSKVDVKSQATV